MSPARHYPRAETNGYNSLYVYSHNGRMQVPNLILVEDRVKSKGNEIIKHRQSATKIKKSDQSSPITLTYLPVKENKQHNQ